MQPMQKRTLGTFLMVVQGIMLTAFMAVIAHVKERGWPDFTFVAINNAMSTFTVAAALAITRTSCPPPPERKWVALVGNFAALSTLAIIFAVRLGTPLGDIAALTSLNGVTAALLGRVFLGEPLRWAHCLALASSCAGALLVSRPAAVFGGTTSPNWLGYILAPLSGFFDACILICCRKSANTPTWWHTISFTCQCGVLSLALPHTPFASNVPIKSVDVPWLAGTLVLLMAMLDLSGMAMFSLGAQWCPAGASATVDTATRMICGYATQVLFFGNSLEPLSAIGAGLMILGVVTMAKVRHPDEAAADAGAQASESSTQEPELAEAASVSTAPDREDSETESLASFIALEFVGGAPKVRQRRPGADASLPPAQMLGVVAALPLA